MHSIKRRVHCKIHIFIVNFHNRIALERDGKKSLHDNLSIWRLPVVQETGKKITRGQGTITLITKGQFASCYKGSAIKQFQRQHARKKLFSFSFLSNFHVIEASTASKRPNSTTQMIKFN